jgi:hypothetical protein
MDEIINKIKFRPLPSAISAVGALSASILVHCEHDRAWDFGARR